MVIGNFKNSRGHLEAYTAIVQNDHIRPILGLITMPIVINVEPVFLIRAAILQTQLGTKVKALNFVLACQHCLTSAAFCFSALLCSYVINSHWLS